MKHILFALAVAVLVGQSTIFTALAEESVKHLHVPDVVSLDEAKQVFANTTAQLKEKTKFDAAELHDIHMITYSLEKAIAFFVDNMDGDQEAAAQKMAEVIELVHIGSENNRGAETKAYLNDYHKLADAFSESL